MAKPSRLADADDLAALIGRPAALGLSVSLTGPRMQLATVDRFALRVARPDGRIAAMVQAWPGGPSIEWLQTQQRLQFEALTIGMARWNALPPEQQAAEVAARQMWNRSDGDQQDAARANAEGAVVRLMSRLREAGNPGLVDRTMTAVKHRFFGADQEVPVPVGQAWPCGDVMWVQRESSSAPPRVTLPSGVSPEGQLVPMHRLLISEDFSVPAGFAAVLSSGLRVLYPVDAQADRMRSMFENEVRRARGGESVEPRLGMDLILAGLREAARAANLSTE